MKYLIQLILYKNDVKPLKFGWGGGGGGRPPPQRAKNTSPPSASLSLVTSTNIEISPKNFVTFSFNPFATLVQYCKAIFGASPKLLSLNLERCTKKWFF